MVRDDGDIDSINYDRKPGCESLTQRFFSKTKGTLNLQIFFEIP